MASKRPISQEGEDGDGTSPRPLKRSQPCHHCCREAMENLALEIEQRIVRRMQEEVQSIRSLLNHEIPALSGPRPPISNLNNGVSRFRLHFDTKLPQILFTYRKIEVVGSEPLQIVIRDARSNEIVSSGPFSTLKIRIVALNGNFCGDGREWTKDAFIQAIIPQRKDKRPLLIGALEYSLSNGVSQPIDAKFTDNSSWSVDGFRLAAMVSDDISLHVRVLEAISEAFRVKDCRVESNQKVDPPLLNENVWRLRNIGRDGPFHKKLADAKIDTVQDFLRSLTMDPDRLRELLGRPKKFWDTIVEHARESTLGSKLYSYCIEEKGIVLVFNSIFELVGANINSGFFRPLSALSHSEKELAENLKSVAYKNSENMDEFFGSLDVTSVPGSSVASPEIYYHSVTSLDDPIRMISQQQTYLPQNGYSSTEHGFYFHQNSSFQMPYSTQALSGPINTNVSLSMNQCLQLQLPFPDHAHCRFPLSHLNIWICSIILSRCPTSFQETSIKTFLQARVFIALNSQLLIKQTVWMHQVILIVVSRILIIMLYVIPSFPMRKWHA